MYLLVYSTEMFLVVVVCVNPLDVREVSSLAAWQSGSVKLAAWQSGSVKLAA